MDKYQYARSNSAHSLRNANERTSGHSRHSVDETNHSSSHSNMGYSIYALQPNPHITDTSPPTKKLKNSNLDTQTYISGRESGEVEQNISSTRINSSQSLNNIQSNLRTERPSVLLRSQSHNESDEDERFLRLAREALVATASAAKSNPNALVVDPTIEDLLKRLQYVSSPHGNPISRSDRIRANENGQLMIQDFYQDFPNLSNDVFTENRFGEHNDNLDQGHPAESSHEDWNFLIGEPLHLELKETPSVRRRDEDSSLLINRGPTSGHSDNSQLDKNTKDDDDRTFLCSKCALSFRRSSDLKRHEKQHLSVPPNICELCGKGFARKDALKRHSGTLTCKRNADRKIYIENLNYLRGPNAYNDSSDYMPLNNNSRSDW